MEERREEMDNFFVQRAIVANANVKNRVSVQVEQVDLGKHLNQLSWREEAASSIDNTG